MPQVILTATQLHVQIAGNVLVDNQDLLLHEGERVGLIGRNGSGKSTLLKILAGKEHFYTGDVTLTRGVRAAYLPQEVDLTHGKTVRENILEGAQDRELFRLGIVLAHEPELRHSAFAALAGAVGRHFVLSLGSGAVPLFLLRCGILGMNGFLASPFPPFPPDTIW